MSNMWQVILRNDDALFADISAHVKVASQGYTIFGITYTNASPKITQEVVQATIQNFGEERAIRYGRQCF